MNSQPPNFKDLVAWQRAMDLAPVVYELIQNFPAIERYGLADQIRRAVISVSANIAEGQGRHHPKEFAYFLDISRGSLTELESLLIVAFRLKYIDAMKLQNLADQIISIRRPLHGLIQSIRTPRDSRNSRSPAFPNPNPLPEPTKPHPQRIPL
jgi:four helix bundle protein